MRKVIVALLAILMVVSTVSVVGAYGLTGKWSCNDGGTYYITQIGEDIYWYGEQKANHPAWANVAKGVRGANGKIYLEWSDVPKGQIMQHGILVLVIQGHNTLVRDEATGGFGGSVWHRMQ